MLTVGPLFYSTKYYDELRLPFESVWYERPAIPNCSYHQVRESAIFRGDSFAPLERWEEPPLELALPRPLAESTTTLTYRAYGRDQRKFIT
jgi:hypothetical protein